MGDWGRTGVEKDAGAEDPDSGKLGTGRGASGLGLTPPVKFFLLCFCFFSFSHLSASPTTGRLIPLPGTFPAWQQKKRAWELGWKERRLQGGEPGLSVGSGEEGKRL